MEILRAPQLPAPTPDQQAASQALQALIVQRIESAGGWISFANYMRLALYAPGLGYYSGGSQKFGAAGDFTTAPEMTPLFGQTLAQTVAQVLQQTGGDVLELGAGSGRLAVDLLRELEHLNALPQRYSILELSGELAERQRALIAFELPHLVARVAWLTALPNDFVGCMLGNEVLDAVPCRVLTKRQGEWLERGVAQRNGQLIWQDNTMVEQAVVDDLSPFDLPDGYITEHQTEAAALVASLFSAVKRGVLLLVDYGFHADSYYHPQRQQGTLMCHYRHHAHDDPFFLPGLQDITTHIDFSAIWAAGTQAGWSLEGYVTQAAYLLDAGLLDALARIPAGSAAYFQASAAVQKLLSPAEMGELFKVIAFSKELNAATPLPGFRRQDDSAYL